MEMPEIEGGLADFVSCDYPRLGVFVLYALWTETVIVNSGMDRRYWYWAVPLLV